MLLRRSFLPWCLGVLLAVLAGPGFAQPGVVKVAVLDDAPPMSYRDGAGNLTGFSIELTRALCDEMRVSCEFQATRLDYIIDDLVTGGFDLAAVGLLNTQERRRKILFSQPFYRSISLWFGREGVSPGQPGVRVSTFRGSAQERYAKSRGWDALVAHSDSQMIEQLTAGVSQGMIVPLMTSFNLQKNPHFLRLGLMPTVLHAPELEGDACFGISPRRADLKEALDEALATVRRNGVYDRINTQFLPFRVD